MSEEAFFGTPATGSSDATIAIDNQQQLKAWAESFDVSKNQIREAVAAVGASTSDVEMHLKRSRSSTSSEQAKASPGS